MPLARRVTRGKPNPTERSERSERNENEQDREGWILLIIILLSGEGEHPNATDLIRLFSSPAESPSTNRDNGHLLVSVNRESNVLSTVTFVTS